MKRGETQRAAAKLAGETVGVSSSTIRRWAERAGTPLARFTADHLAAKTAAASAARRICGVAEQREANSRLLELTDHAIDQIERDVADGPVTDEHMRRVGRIGVQLKRATDIDAALDRRGAPVGAADDEQGLVSEEKELARLRETFEIVKRWDEEDAAEEQTR